MPRLELGLLLGLAAGSIDLLIMLPMRFPDKRTALTAAFSSRFAIGFLAANCSVPGGPIVSGAVVVPASTLFTTKQINPRWVSGGLPREGVS